MSGPNPPGREPDEPDPGSELSHEPGSGGESADELRPDEIESHDELEPLDEGAEIPAGQTGQTDAYSRAYSAPESEHFISGPYLPADLRLYDYDGSPQTQSEIAGISKVSSRRVVGRVKGDPEGGLTRAVAPLPSNAWSTADKPKKAENPWMRAKKTRTRRLPV